jgi:hypothetical protein
MKSEKEQHGQELGPKTPQEYADYHELAPQRPTFEDAEHQTNSAGKKYAGHDRSWSDAATKVSPQGDGKPGPVTPISGGSAEEGGDTARALKRTSPHSIVDKYLGGKNFDPVQGRVPDAGKEFQPSAPVGHPKMYPNEGPQTPAFNRPTKLGWKERYKDALRPDVAVGDAMTVGSGISQTPQRKKLRKSESKA